jgi:hypothetical protein
MLDAIVQLLRNAMCCIKDLHWFPESIVHKEYGAYEYLLKGFLDVTLLPEPLNKTSLLEFFISWTQLYACLSTCTAGIQLTWKSVGKLRRLVRLLESRLNTTSNSNSNSNSNNNNSNLSSKVANRIVNESLMQQAKAAIRGVVVGILVTPIGFAFFWLFANSWHVTETPWIGGLLGLIDALTVMELCLLPLLVYMIVDAMDYFAKLRDTKLCIQAVESKQIFSTPNTTDAVDAAMTLSTYEFMMPGWVPFWEAGISPLAAPLSSTEASKRIDMEVAAVQKTLDQWFVVNTNNTNNDNNDDKENDDKEKEQKIQQEALDKSVKIMKASLVELRIKAYREIVYFVLNFIAFYGYLLGIVTFYFPDDEAQPSYVHNMKFGYGNAIADWTGNFAGDLMWTIEPIVILTSPLYLTYVQQQQKQSSSNNKTAEKAKAD